MHFSYDPPDQSLADIMNNALDEIEENTGDDPTQSAAEWLHSQLLLHGERHTLEAVPDRRELVLRMPTSTALALASALASCFKAQSRT
ncbi:hypothetical protein ACF1GW_38670 [Streptomyces achromogenes]|uniref:hypothetical protein n=1 Tax=Streptomyces achromogenes TaxID=67255 RepID=UPI0036FE9277